MKKKLLMLFPGPKYNLEHLFKERCFQLSKHYTGIILTSSEEAAREKFGNFEIICVSDKKVKSLRSTLKILFLMTYFQFRALKDKPFDLIVTYDPLKSGLIALFSTLFTRTKFAVEVNGDYTHLAQYKEFGLIRGNLKRALYIFVERMVLNKARGIKLLYPTQIDYFLPLKNKPVVKIFFNYVNTDNFRNIESNKEVLFIGFPLYIKGVDILIKAYKEIEDKYPDWKLKILGYYPEIHELEDLIGQSKNIFHHPPVDPSEIGSHIGSCGIFVLPSRSEAMGRVLLEAMACSKPRIGSDAGGIPMVIKDEVDGLIFKSEDVQDLTEKLTTLIDSEELRIKLGRNGKKRYLKEFNKVEYISRVSDFYRDVINKE